MIRVELTEYEMQMLEDVGIARNASAHKRNRDPGRGPISGADASHVRGARCEFACSIGLNLFWRPHVGIINQPDVGGIAEVRSTVLPNGKLIVRVDKDKDKDDAPFVLVLQQERAHTLLGWLDGRTAKASAPIERRFGDAAHYVPQPLLRDIHTLKRRLHHSQALDAEYAERRAVITVKPSDPQDLARIMNEVGAIIEPVKVGKP